MPKKSWKIRTEKLRELSAEELSRRLQYLERPVSARLARWAYEDILADDLDSPAKIAALLRIGMDAEAPWRTMFLWKELDRHKYDALGDWVIEGLTHCTKNDVHDVDRYLELTADPNIHPYTAGSALFGLSTSVLGLQRKPGRVRMEIDEPLKDQLSEVCAAALADKKNPYRRAGGCRLAQTLGMFRDLVQELAADSAPIRPGESPVSMYAKDALEDYDPA